MDYLLLLLNLSVLVVLYLLYRWLRPVRASPASTEKWLALLTETAETCRGQAKLMSLVEGVSAQFHTDGGLSMKDAVNRLDAAAKQQFEAAEALKTGVREDRMKAELDREQLQRLLIEQHRLMIKLEKAIATTDRIEGAAAGVANDLAASQRRADDVVSGDPGAAADAGAQSEREKE